MRGPIKYVHESHKIKLAPLSHKEASEDQIKLKKKQNKREKRWKKKRNERKIND